MSKAVYGKFIGWSLEPLWLSYFAPRPNVVFPPSLRYKIMTMLVGNLRPHDLIFDLTKGYIFNVVYFVGWNFIRLTQVSNK